VSATPDHRSPTTPTTLQNRIAASNASGSLGKVTKEGPQRTVLEFPSAAFRDGFLDGFHKATFTCSKSHKKESKSSSLFRLLLEKMIEVDGGLLFLICGVVGCASGASTKGCPLLGKHVDAWPLFHQNYL